VHRAAASLLLAYTTERPLLYVACTRARDYLIVTAAAAGLSSSTTSRQKRKNPLHKTVDANKLVPSLFALSHR
jgi:ATP-dependent exoDNAse (exonuclease V) beta subunit